MMSKHVEDEFGQHFCVWVAGIPCYHTHHIIDVPHKAETSKRIMGTGQSQIVVDRRMKLMFIVHTDADRVCGASR